MKKKRVMMILGILVAPFVGSFIYALLAVMGGRYFTITLILTLAVAYIQTLIFATPAYLILRKKNKLTFTNILFFGVLCASLPSLIYLAIMLLNYESLKIGGQVLVEGSSITEDGFIFYTLGSIKLILSGAISSVVFYLFFSRHSENHFNSTS